MSSLGRSVLVGLAAGGRSARRTTLVEGVRGCNRVRRSSEEEVPTVVDGRSSLGRETAQTVLCAPFPMGVAPGGIVAGFDVHRRQITFDALDTVTGETWRGSWNRAPRRSRTGSAGSQAAEVHVAVEACTGWLFVSRALERKGAVAHLAEPVETSALRGRKRRAKTDRTDAKWLRQLLCEGRTVAGGMEPAGACAPMALPHEVAQLAGGRADRLDPANPRHPVSPRHPRRPG